MALQLHMIVVLLIVEWGPPCEFVCVVVRVVVPFVRCAGPNTFEKLSELVV